MEHTMIKRTHLIRVEKILEISFDRKWKIEV